MLGLGAAAQSSNGPAEPDAAVVGRATAAAIDPVAESSAPPGVVLVLTLALGLAIGGAGGFLLGQRSAARPHEPAAGRDDRRRRPRKRPRRPRPRRPRRPRRRRLRAPSHPSSTRRRRVGRAPSRPRGELIVQSTPAQAGVVVNNVWRGRTPLTLRGLSFGTHTVRVDRARLRARDAPRARSTRAFRRRPCRCSSRAPAPAARRGAPAPTPSATTGSLYIESRPTGARVLVDGRLVGSTPLLISELAPGRARHPPRARRLSAVDDDGADRSGAAPARRGVARRGTTGVRPAGSNGASHNVNESHTRARKRHVVRRGERGAPGETGGEVVFNTSMTGYQEVLTDPSYAGQIVTMTAPRSATTASRAEDGESRGAAGRRLHHARRVADRQQLARRRHARATISCATTSSPSRDIDTRALTRVLRSTGVMRGVIATGDVD